MRAHCLVDCYLGLLDPGGRGQKRPHAVHGISRCSANNGFLRKQLRRWIIRRPGGAAVATDPLNGQRRSGVSEDQRTEPWQLTGS
ncbi:hypothetical protein T01_15421 [Trichinella spiralis]|uniref:Uncharacterized protein n=1 Tax=Trichinella spiralis TaxID=6334 RepID=A0A0V1BWJ7_TRISP|nr:hypothetical protein T01_15421 [Trichinella spiralis]